MEIYQSIRIVCGTKEMKTVKEKKKNMKLKNGSFLLEHKNKKKTEKNGKENLKKSEEKALLQALNEMQCYEKKYNVKMHVITPKTTKQKHPGRRRICKTKTIYISHFFL